jgi:hypothetical protein
MGLLAAQPRVYASVNWAKLITCKMADLTREGQPLSYATDFLQPQRVAQFAFSPR